MGGPMVESLAGRRGQWWPGVALGNTDRGTTVSRGLSLTWLVRVGGDIQLVDGQIGCIRWRQAGSGMARNRARAERSWVSQGQPLGRCRVRPRALRVIWTRPGWWRGSVYWVLLVLGPVYCYKPLSQMHRSTFLRLQVADPAPSFRWIRAYPQPVASQSFSPAPPCAGCDRP